LSGLVGDAVVAHHYWSFGGETTFNINLARVLCRLGYRVRVASVTKLPAFALEALRGACVREIKSLIPLRVNAFAIYQRLLLGHALKKVLAPEAVVWVDSPTYRAALGKLRENKNIVVDYINFPWEFADDKELLERLPEPFRNEVVGYFENYRKSLLKNIYFSIYLRLQRFVARRDPWETADIVLANSKYIARIVEYVWGRTPGILSPPVNTSDFSRVASIGYRERRNSVFVIGRITPEKRLETVIDAAALAESRPSVVLAGAVAASKRKYLEFIRERAKKQGVNLTVHISPPREVLVREAGMARAYVHAAIGEHFGIAVVEAMAAGLPVIVHRSGGPYYEIIDEGRWGLHFGSVEELAENLDRVLLDEATWSRYSRLSTERARHYSLEAFSEKVKGILAEAGTYQE